MELAVVRAAGEVPGAEGEVEGSEGEGGGVVASKGDWTDLLSSTRAKGSDRHCGNDKGVLWSPRSQRTAFYMCHVGP